MSIIAHSYRERDRIIEKDDIVNRIFRLLKIIVVSFLVNLRTTAEVDLKRDDPQDECSFQIELVQPKS